VDRIAMLSVHTCPLATLGGKETGGMNVYVRELTRELSRRGLAVDVFTRSQDPTIPRVRPGGPLGPRGRVIHLPAGPEKPYNKNDVYQHLPQFVQGVLAFAQAEGIRYDVLHSHYWLSALAAEELREVWGTPIVHMFHTLGKLKNQVAQSPTEREGEQRIVCEGEIMRFADRIVAATALEREQMGTLYGADPARIAVVPPGVDLTRFHRLPAAEARARIGVPADHQMILFVGRIQPIKGIDTLIRAVALLLEREPELRQNTCLAIIGGDPEAGSGQGELANLQALREALGVGDLVTFLGSKDQDTLANYYAAAATVVVPSHYESFGMVALEAMACGTPVIASDVGGLSVNIAEGFNGYLVPAGDVEALASKLALLLKYPSLREHLGDQALHWAERFGWNHIADDLMIVYQQALAARHRDGEDTATNPSPHREATSWR
jgi:D-inositol-3-phosphate glycosyltransferase